MAMEPVLDFTHAHLHKCMHFFLCARKFSNLHAHCACIFFSHKFQDEQELKEIAHFNKLSRNQITVFLVFCYLCSVFFIKALFCACTNNVVQVNILSCMHLCK